MERKAKLIGIIGIVVLLVSFIGSYAYYRSRDFMNGPQLSVTSPADGSLLLSPLVEITGTAANVAYLTLNDNQIFVDGSGTFREKLLLSDGYNIMKLSATDRFGRTMEKKLELVYKGTNQPPTVSVVPPKIIN